jgi:hypothetical protein
MMAYLLRLCMFLPFLVWETLVVWSPLVRAESQSTDVATLEQQVHELVNNHRTAIGLEPLGYSEDIARIARRHSRDMANGYVGMGHEGADERGRVLARTITYNQFAENVAANSQGVSSTAEAAVAGWLNSPGHRVNIEGNYTLSGIGIARSGNAFFFTQIFLITARSSRPAMEPRRSRKDTSEQSDASEPDHNESSFRRRRADTSVSEEAESDPRRRAGRKRVRGGYVQDLEAGH